VQSVHLVVGSRGERAQGERPSSCRDAGVDRIERALRRATPLVVAASCAMAAHLVVLRPWYLEWGATDAERAASLPGDEHVAARTRTTRAITVRATPAVTWAWVSQIGQDRGGFYSFEALEDAAGARITNADRLLDLPPYRVGDVVWMAPPDAFGGAGRADVIGVDEGHALVLGTRQMGRAPTGPLDGAWSFVVEPAEGTARDGASRLLVRSIAGGERTWTGRLFDRLVFDPIHFVMERRMLQGVAARAEGRVPSKWADDLGVHAMIVAGLSMAFGCIASLRTADPRRSLLTALLAMLGFQVVTIVEPSFALALALVALQLLLAIRKAQPLLPLAVSRLFGSRGGAAPSSGARPLRRGRP
jgi:hypothetical protein